MTESNSEKKAITRIKGGPLSIIFYEESYFILKQKKSIKIPENLISKEVMIDVVRIIKSINFKVVNLNKKGNFMFD